MATTTTSCSRASSRARCAVTAVFPTRLPVPITAIDGSSNGANDGGSKRKSAPTYGDAGGERTRDPAEALGRAEHRLVREVDHDLGVAEAVDERHADVEPAAQLLGSADEDRAHPLVRQRPQRVAHHGRVVLPVNERDSAHHRFAVTSRSMRPVYFSYSPVDTSNWMIRS